MCHPEVPAGQVAPEVNREEVLVPVPGGEQMPALLTRPDGREGAAVLIINDVFGRSPFYEDLAARLAKAGFVGFCPEYFFRQGPLPEFTQPAAMARKGNFSEQQWMRDLNAAVDWLKQQPGVRGDRVGTIGFCMGGTAVLNLAADRDDLASVCFYGFPQGSGGSRERAPAPLDRIDEVHGPLLAFWGDQDTGVGMDNVDRLVQGLKRRGVDFKHTIFPGLGHGFLRTSGLDPNHEMYKAACQAWTDAVEFYRERLGAATPA